MENSEVNFKFEMSFFKVLYSICKKTSVYLKIPDTLLLGFGFEHNILITTLPENGRLVFKKKIVPEAVKETFLYFSEQQTDPVFPIAVYKTGFSSDQCHSKVLFTPQECAEKWAEKVEIGKSIQKFVLNNNTLAIFHSSWDNLESKLNVSEVIKHKNVRAVNEAYKKTAATTKRKNFNKELRTKALRDMYLIMENDAGIKVSSCINPEIERKMMYLVQIFERYYLVDPNLKLISIDVDWIQDSNGEIFLLSVRKYRVGQIKAVKQTISLFSVPRVPVCLSKRRTSIDFRKKIKGGSDKMSKSCSSLSVA